MSAAEPERVRIPPNIAEVEKEICEHLSNAMKVAFNSGYKILALQIGQLIKIFKSEDD